MIAIVSRLRIMIVAAFMAGLLFGVWRGMTARTDLSVYRQYIGQEVRIIGTIADDPDVDASNVVKLRIENVEIITQSDDDRLQGEPDITSYFEPMPGQIWLSSVMSFHNIKRGDHVEASGTLKGGFGSYADAISIAHRASGVVPMLVIVANSLKDIPALIVVSGLVFVALIMFLLQHYLAKMNNLEAKNIW
jgi:hypothetical protein